MTAVDPSAATGSSAPRDAATASVRTRPLGVPDTLDTALGTRSGIGIAVATRDRAAQVVACVLLFAVGTETDVHASFTLGDILLVITGALWFTAYRRFRGAGVFLGWGLLTAVFGIVLAEYQTATRSIDHATMRDSTVLLLGLLGGVMAVLWARTLIDRAAIATSFGLGMVVGAGLHPGTWSTNPWKFAFAAPVTVLVLGLALRMRRPATGIVPLLALSAVSVALDYRSYTATMALAALLLVWRCLPKRQSSRYGWVWTTGVIAGVAGLVYWLGTSLLVGGYLGADVQARTVSQIDTSGSLILGERPELAATWALLRHHVMGFGVGAIPTANDVQVASQGMASINYNPDNGYVDRFMFGGHYELHSVLGDVWASWGLPGLALVAAVAYLALRALAQSVSRRTGDALVLYLCVWTLWNLMFSPLLPCVPILVLTVGLTLSRRRSPGPVGASG